MISLRSYKEEVAPLPEVDFKVLEADLSLVVDSEFDFALRIYPRHDCFVFGHSWGPAFYRNLLEAHNCFYRGPIAKDRDLFQNSAFPKSAERDIPTVIL